MTSSKIKRELFAVAISLKSLRKSFSPGTKPIFPAIGSTIMAARSSFTNSKTFKNSSLLLKLQLEVCLARSSGIPGESGRPKVKTPEPAFIRSESTWP